MSTELLERLRDRLPLTETDASWIQFADPTELNHLLREIADTMPDIEGLEQFAVLLARRLRSGDRSWDGVVPLTELYDKTSPLSLVRGALLQFLVEDASAPALAAVADRLTHDPPQVTAAVAQALSPLYRDSQSAAHALALLEFCRDAMEHISVAAPLLDLSNYLCRERGVGHPAAGSEERLRTLLRAIVNKLEQLAEQNEPFAASDEESMRQLESQREMVELGVPLAVSLCDTLALLEDHDAVGVLTRALDLPHRRIRTEAGWALAKLGEDAGLVALREQAADPYTRLRALEYLQELERLDQLDPQLCSELARAEASVCSWLGEATQFGIPPHEIELVEQRELAWPGFEEEQTCYLFRFAYRFPHGTLENIALAGPAVHAFATDLTDMDADDVFAMYAGWQAEHDEMEEFIPQQLTPSGQVELERLVRRIRDCGYEEIEPLLFCIFFGDKSLVASAVPRADAERTRGLVVADDQDAHWFPARSRFGAVEAAYVYKGRRLLRAFNS
ncbi:MAG: HEAT repeat domain-containing protein [Planctomycetales bacterium]|nr:HEAT repeat domain-containing protein [Planctomycetales bacterium]